MLEQSLLEVRQEIVDRLGVYLGEWSIPNLTSQVTAIGITPDPESGDIYPPPGTQLNEGVECVIRAVDFTAPWLESNKYQLTVEVVIAAPKDLVGLLLASLAVLVTDGSYFIQSNKLVTNDGSSQKIIKLRTYRRITTNG